MSNLSDLWHIMVDGRDVFFLMGNTDSPAHVLASRPLCLLDHPLDKPGVIGDEAKDMVASILTYFDGNMFLNFSSYKHLNMIFWVNITTSIRGVRTYSFSMIHFNDLTSITYSLNTDEIWDGYDEWFTRIMSAHHFDSDGDALLFILDFVTRSDEMKFKHKDGQVRPYPMPLKGSL